MTRTERNFLLAGLAVALVVGGGISYFASAWPDGLEKTIEDLGAAEPPHRGIEAPPVAFEEYSLKWLGEGFWANAAAGAVGCLVVAGMTLAVGRLLRARPTDGAPGGPAEGSLGAYGADGAGQTTGAAEPNGAARAAGSGSGERSPTNPLAPPDHQA